MPYRACVFQHGSDYTHVHSSLSKSHCLIPARFNWLKTRFLVLDTIVSTWAFQRKSEDNVTPKTLAWLTRSMSLSSRTIRGIDATWLSLRQKHVIISLVFLAFIRMSLRLDQSVITSADSCSIGTLVLLQTSNTVLSSTYLNMGHGVCKSLIWTKHVIRFPLG